MLVAGDNIIAVEGTNEGTIANPAGILFAMKVVYEDGNEVLVRSDKEWKSTAEIPAEGWTQLEYEDTEWAKVRNYGSGHWGRLVNFSFEESHQKFARASLVKQHPFMKAMGRPTRENVATSRDAQATLLQALELTNGDYFNSVLAEGAHSWLKQYGANGDEIVTAFYEKSLGRSPSKKEHKLMLDALGGEPQAETLQDLFWATLNLPEFQFIY